MPSTPLTCCSTGAATVSATTLAFAPGYDADTSTVGGVISGYCAIGSANKAILPASVMTIDSTQAKIGRSMKKRENTKVPHSFLFPFSARNGCASAKRGQESLLGRPLALAEHTENTHRYPHNTKQTKFKHEQ